MRPMPASPPLEVIPLGGCGEFGLNLTCYRYDGDLLAVDCGLMFPEDGMYGVDLVLPDFSFLRDHAATLHGYVITHGHEDHLGALPFALREAPAPVYATGFTLSLLREKLAENNPGHKIELVEIHPREPIAVGPFTVEPIRVAHSIPDAVSLALRCEAGLAVHTGDFKMVGPGLGAGNTDTERLEALGDEGVLVAVADSTGALEPGLCGSEADVAEPLADLFATSSGRIFMAQFASNIERCNTVARLCRRFGRRLVLEGRSLRQYARHAEPLGLLSFPPGLRATVEELQSLPPRRAVVLVTGTQGEPGSVLRRLALGDHPSLQVQPGDTVVLSSRIIPGNERKVNRLVDLLCRQGATVVDAVRDRRVHVSGHGYREDLRRMLLLLKPGAVIPVHGRYRMLIEHAEIAHQVGVERIQIPHNGDIIEVNDPSIRTTGRVEAGRIMVDGKGVGDVEELVLRDRRHLAATGTVVALLTLDSSTGDLMRPPELTAVGVLRSQEHDEILGRATRALAETVGDLPPSARSLPEELAEVVRRRLRGFFRKELDRKPVIIPLVIEQ
jgi:ribonuclease J